jgi:hypothetical protein
MNKNLGHSTHSFGKSLSLPLILYYTEKLLCVLV